ncbi:hypothetical protein Zmor_004393 [Zophobas morio]|uniref:WD repeat-containing protein 55 homolog n=1 Tax=Zophobas morio TaxID=2755281 RepID=A0AA38HHW1_9CUCU|nr:hypothetical protein Zmor_004393 [Zophobas morio]
MNEHISREFKLVVAEGFTSIKHNQSGDENSAKLLTKFECPVRCLSLDASGTYVAAGSDDSTIKILDLNNKENITELSGHQNSIRSLAYDPLGEFLLSSSCDGTLRVWNLRKSGCLVVSLDILEKISDPE